MTNQEIREMLERQNVIRGYVYTYEGSRSEYWFEKSPSNIANFIMLHEDARKIILTDTMDNLILNTIGEFIDHCEDQVLLQEILPQLVPMQMGEAERQEISVATDAQMEAYYGQHNEMNMEFGM